MSKEKAGLISWVEWQKAAWAQSCVESGEGFPLHSSVRTRPSGIECPNTYVLGTSVRPCRANLLDTNIVVECGTEKRRVVHCEVCCWWGCRLVGVE